MPRAWHQQLFLEHSSNLVVFYITYKLFPKFIFKLIRQRCAQHFVDFIERLHVLDLDKIVVFFFDDFVYVEQRRCSGKHAGVDWLEFKQHIHSLTLFSLNLATGERTQIADNIGGDSTRNINALGYNAREDYLYGISQNEGATDFKIIRILANGTGTYVATVSKLTTGLFNSGDIDENGQYWISTGGADFYQYNFAPGTANYGGLVNSGKLSGTGGYTIGDWTVVPGVGGGDLWSVGVSNQVAYLLRWSRTTHVFTVVRNLGNLTGATGTTVPFWGASYATTDGYLFAVENGSGQIWRIAVDGSSTPLRLKDAPVSSRNDGARCLDSGAIVVSG
ncbi:proline rich protein 5MeD [Colletotrichum fioriniae PJ7]|uniref:Proline rich protein 5MeD n=1 Tax=Colletotrichum fioriniae PJ7 TaxID=1445577 RepID=A0A010R5Y5_9PEZI|nr:proline rich protein 5MeD [Colletotrichum fioriniae PJ7]